MTTAAPLPIADPLRDTVEAARYLGLKNAKTLCAWRLRRQGPRYVRLGTAVRYKQSDLDAFIAAGAVDPSAAP
jgi:predicted DNA-binding transcriptional regulator AlpA